MQRTDLEFWTSREVARLLSLVEGEKRYFQEMVARSPVGFAVLNREMGVVSANRAFRQIFGIRQAETGGVSIADLPVQGLDGAAKSVLAGGGKQESFHAEVATPAGARSLQITMAGFRDWGDEGEDEVLVAVQDVTAAVEQVRGVGESAAAKLREQVGKLPGLAWELDTSTMKFLWVNQQAIETMRLPAEHWVAGADFLGERVAEPDRNAVRSAYLASMARGKPFSIEYRSDGAGGQRIWLCDTVRPENGRAYGITVDVTAARLGEEAAAQARKVEALTKLSGRVVHDCNNLLMITSGYGEDLLQGLPQDSPLRSNVQQILDAGERLRGLMSQLTAYVSHPSPEKQVFPIDPLVTDLRDELRKSLTGSVDLVVNCRAWNVHVNADPALVVHAIRTIAARAADAVAGAGTISIETSVFEYGFASGESRGVLAPGAYAVIEIRDNGHAIHPDLIAQVFEPALATEIARYNFPAIYKSIREMGGDVSVRSEYETGSTFRLLLPATSPEGQTAVAAAEAKPAPAASTILIVEDEAGIRALMRRILDREGYHLLEAGHGKAALELSRNHPGTIDLLVTDVVMPEMSGFELARSLRAIRPDLRVLFISGYTGLSGFDAEQLSPGSAFLQKPFTLNAFVAKVRDLLEK